MTDRFNNGDKLNDLNYNRIKTAGKCVDLKWHQRNSKKIDEGYFDKLGINAIWFTQ
jgi:alpha-amylase